ncbi:nucleotide disphospho-sugar-binding domain-containing protein [Streptomyces sp. SID11385]|uniref:nucleotide disphospho-sugar-binding domain-containing protein n=1 Tax=Streptomyces sp. SID11385 TaxID=2706031 RepID=UPI0013C88062|nr:nucleotide disphospho-sugar-binding domain-containing protein [Streptomyces sp. SID11385]NEA44194.1 hypothetical protein [Streptomyces sp. SID11385]
MRVLLVTWNATAHLPALVPLALALRAAGHEVVAAAPPEAAAGAVRRSLAAVAVGPDLAAPPARGATFRRWPDGWPSDPSVLDEGERQFLHMLAGKQVAAAAAMLPDLVEFGERWRPHLVLHDASSLAGPVLAARLGLPAVGHSWGRVLPVRMDVDRSTGQQLPSVAALFERFAAGRAAVPGIELEPCPPALRLRQKGGQRDIRPVPVASGLLPPAALRAGTRPRVLLVPEGRHPGAGTLRELAGALTTEGFEVTSAEPGTAIAPATRRAVVVHPGSAAPLLEAAATGTPQLVLSTRPEQQLVGAAVADTGCGLHHVRSELGPGPAALAVLCAAVRELADEPRFREAAGRVAASAAATPSPADVARTLPDLLPGA